MKKAIIFDLDGTLADTIGSIKEALDLVRAEFGMEPLTYERLKEFFSKSADDYAYNSLPEEMRSEENIKKAKALYIEKYSETYSHVEKCYDGLGEVIGKLKDEYRLAVYSNKNDEFVKALSEKLFGKGFFDIALGVRKGHKPKPDPEGVNEICDFFGILPSECIFVGDSEIDIFTAKNSGATPVSVSWGYMDIPGLLSFGAEYIAKDPGELYRIIKSF